MGDESSRLAAGFVRPGALLIKPEGMTVTDQPVARKSKRNIGTVLAILVAVLVVAGAAVGATLLLTKKNTPITNSSNNVSAQNPNNSSNSSSTSQYKLAACKSGTSQTLGNAGYVVGTDLAPGTYSVKDALTSTDQGVGWTNIDIYAKQSDFKGHNDGNAQDYIQPNVGETDHTTLKDGQYVSVWSDDAVFTCQ